MHFDIDDIRISWKNSFKKYQNHIPENIDTLLYVKVKELEI